MVLRGDEQFPIVAVTTFEKWLRVPDGRGLNCGWRAEKARFMATELQLL